MTDDVVHVNQAAKVLGCSRRTVERMIERAELERDMSHDAATVTKTSLVAALERRRGEPVDVSQLSRDLSRPAVPADVSRDVRDILQPLVEQVVEARTAAAEAGARLRLLEERAASLRDVERELELERAWRARLVSAGFWERRRLLKQAPGGVV